MQSVLRGSQTYAAAGSPVPTSFLVLLQPLARAEISEAYATLHFKYIEAKSEIAEHVNHGIGTRTLFIQLLELMRDAGSRGLIRDFSEVVV